MDWIPINSVLTPFLGLGLCASGTMENTEIFYAPDAADRIVTMFRSFGGAEAVPLVVEA